MHHVVLIADGKTQTVNTDKQEDTSVRRDLIYVESLYWIALCIYFEARGEPIEGQIAVAHVIMNRALKRNMSVKEIILQPKQFSWTHDGIPDDVKNHAAFIECMHSALIARSERLDGKNLKFADHYHADSVDPYWNRGMKKVTKIGHHIFYRA